VLVAQLTDTHIVAGGDSYMGHDTERYLRDAIAAIVALPERPTLAVVTGDLTNTGTQAEYERFAAIMEALPMPYFVVPGNHDDRATLRATLPPQTYGRSDETTIRFAIEDYPVRLVGLDGNRARPWPGATLDDNTLRWLDERLARPQPTIVAVHQPPFRTGIHYLDAFGFRGAQALRKLVARHPHVGRVICGHIHCIRQTHVGRTLVTSAPSTAPTTLPLLFMEGKIAGSQREAPGFAIHGWSGNQGFVTTIYRRDDRGAYLPLGG